LSTTGEEQLQQQLEHGFTRIPNHCLEALGIAGLNGIQTAVCLFILRRTYGWNHIESPITLPEFAQACETTKEYVSKQIIRLLHMNIVRRRRHQGRLYYHLETDLSVWKTGSDMTEKLGRKQLAGLYRYTRPKPLRSQQHHTVHNEHRTTPSPGPEAEIKGPGSASSVRRSD